MPVYFYMLKKINNILINNKSYLKYLVPLSLLVIAGFSLYYQTLSYGYTNLDDYYLIVNNQHFLSNLSNIFKSFTTDVFYFSSNTAYYYRPILTISLMIDYQFGGTSPFFYHLTNIILHIASSYLLYLFLIKLNYKKALSFLFSLIFLVHPVLTQAVAWIPGRNDSLLAILVLSTFIFFLKYLEKDKIINLLLSIIFFTLAIFTKETGLLLVPMLFFYLYFIYKKGKLPLDKFYFFIGALGIIELWEALRYMALGKLNPVTLTQAIKSFYLNFPATIQFFGKIFFPFNLSVMPTIQDTTFFYGIISIILLIAIIIFTKIKRWNYIIFGFLWFFAFLLPSYIVFNQTTGPYFIEHRLYVPIIGIFIVLLETDLISKINFKHGSLLIILGVIILFTTITFRQSENFKDELFFWKNASDNSPHFSWAHQRLGYAKYSNNDTKGAENEFEKAILLSPDYDDAYHYLGLSYLRENNIDEAVKNWRKVLVINPDHIQALEYLTRYYYEKKDYDKASHYIKILEEKNASLSPELLKVIRQ